MKKHTQTLTVKEHGHGNCYQATLACMLNVELYQVIDIALFFDIQPLGENWFTLLQSFLKQKFNVRESFITELREYHLQGGVFPEKYKNIPYMLTGLSSRGVNHVVIYMNGEMIHDVHPERSGVKIDEENTSCSILESLN